MCARERGGEVRRLAGEEGRAVASFAFIHLGPDALPCLVRPQVSIVCRDRGYLGLAGIQLSSVGGYEFEVIQARFRAHVPCDACAFPARLAGQLTSQKSQPIVKREVTSSVPEKSFRVRQNELRGWSGRCSLIVL